jgi:hypothetical protein
MFDQPDPGNSSTVTIHQDFALGGAQPTRVSASADIRLDLAGLYDAYVLDVVFEDPSLSGATYVLSLFFSGGTVYVSEDANPNGDYDNESCFSVTDTNWHHYSLAVDLGARAVWITLDSYPPCEKTLNYASEVPSPWEIGVDVGGAYFDPSDGGPWIVHQDSVVICAE